MPNNNGGGKVYQYDLDGNFIQQFENITHACYINNIHHGHVRKNILGISYTCKKHIYKKIFYTKLPPQLLNIKDKKLKPINQYTLDGQFVKSFNSISEACLEINTPHAVLSKHLNGNKRYKTCKGFIFKFKN